MIKAVIQKWEVHRFTIKNKTVFSKTKSSSLEIYSEKVSDFLSEEKTNEHTKLIKWMEKYVKIVEHKILRVKFWKQ